MQHVPLIYLLFSHINPSNVTLLPHQLTQHIAVPPSSTAQVQNPAALHTLGHHQTTASVPEGKPNRQSYCCCNRRDIQMSKVASLAC